MHRVRHAEGGSSARRGPARIAAGRDRSNAGVTRRGVPSVTETVLIVDDSLTVRMDLVEAFEEAGFQTRPCATVAEARQALVDGEFGVVVLDVLLPDGHGVELLRELRASPATSAAAILMLSTEAEVRDRIRGLQTGADEYVGKPYERGYLVARARELSRARRADGAEERPTILVIDDSATFREELRPALEAAGYRVATATTGEDGLRMAADRLPSAIIVDSVLPGVDGATVIRHVRLDAALRGVPCILLTASEERGTELRALDAGADTFVRKDEDMDVILARVAAILRRAPTAIPGDTTASLLGPKRILAVDDSVTYLQELASTLRDDGYDVVLARSGEEALDLLAVQPVDCILLDLMMPGLSGQETCRRIKAAPIVRDVPVIMLTALEDRSAMIDGLSAGADDYVPKSGEFEVLRARVRAQIRRKQFEEENRRIREELLRRDFEMAEARAARELAETRVALASELERKNKELEAFSYSVSHDLRVPLGSIDGFSQILLEDYADKLDAEGREYLRHIRGSALRMAELIDDLLELARVGRAELSRGPVDLSTSARAIADGFLRVDPERKVVFDIPDSLIVDADGRLMRVLLENLLGNAWKFTSKVPEARIEFGLIEWEGSKTFFIRDNGAGFDMTYAAKLFNPFQRLHGEDEFPGTGIGLATVQRVVDRHGGRVWAEGAVGRGATVFFTVPSNRSASGR
ncbi:MAG: response regulator [Chloroflexota bacterium]|nr:MAG: response regulator [Chloroflexota bacterium]